MICQCSRLVEPGNGCDVCYKLKRREYERTLYRKLREERLAGGFCVKCGKEKVEPPFTRCTSCHATRQNYIKKKRTTYIASKKCLNCGKDATNSKSIELCIDCYDARLTTYRITAKELKCRVVDHYGKTCNCCGESNLEFLTIDHINENGATHRRELFGDRDTCGEKFYRWLISQNFPVGYQVMCFNCNYGKHVNDGICPHQGIRKIFNKSTIKYKSMVLAAYGEHCTCCKEKLPQLLCVDHINGRTDDLRGEKLYRWLVKNNFPEGFQILCFNCNISKYLSSCCIHQATRV